MTITVVYRDHNGFWEASSAQVPALVAGDQDLGQLRIMVREALNDYLENDRLDLVEVLEPISVTQVFG
jgi:hypothetical protein